MALAFRNILATCGRRFVVQSTASTRRGKSDRAWVERRAEDWEKKGANTVVDEEPVDDGKTLDSLMRQREKEEEESRRATRERLQGNATFEDPWGKVQEVVIAQQQQQQQQRKTARPTQNRAELLKRSRERVTKEWEDALPQSPEEAHDALEAAAESYSTMDDSWSESGFYTSTTDPDYMFHVTEDNYTELIEESPYPIIIDFWTPQCTDSVGMTGNLKLLVRRANMKTPLLRLAHVDCNVNYRLAVHLGVHSLPCSHAVYQGHLLESISGLRDEEDMAQFVFGFAQAVNGDTALDHLHEDDIVCKLIDARVALKAQDYETAEAKYIDVFQLASAQYEEEKAAREKLKEEGVFTPEITRPVSEAELLAAKALVGRATVMHYTNRDRQARKLLQQMERSFPKVFRTVSDVRKGAATVHVLICSGYKPTDDVEDLEDEERIDQHNLDIKLRLAGAYFMAGDFMKAMAVCCILVRKNINHRNGIAAHMIKAMFAYLGPHHGATEAYKDKFELSYQHRFSHDFRFSRKQEIALNQASSRGGVLAHEIPKMISPYGNKGKPRPDVLAHEIPKMI
eukprot:Sspe_Gene.87804::Locus_59659_Transcript_4_7_Confidence_0.273_Length_1934::g.87804::m.87804